MLKQQIQTDNVFLIRNFLSKQECEQFIAQSESVGFSAASINTFAGPAMRPDVRNNSRVILDDTELAAQLFERARPFLPTKLDSWQILGFNERWRYYRYDPGERFAPHYDGPFQRSHNEMSLLTFMLYLNEEFTGGSTRFYENPDANIQPEQGTALVFVHRRLHEGAAVLSGRKYVLRTDVVYTRSPMSRWTH